MELGTTELAPNGKKKRSFFKRLLRFFFFLTITLILLVFAAISLVFIYEDEVKAAIVAELNKKLDAEVRIDPKNIGLTIIRSFPDCALEFKNIACMEAVKKKERDTLLFARLLQLKFDIKDLWNGTYDIKKIKLKNAFCRLKIDAKNRPNYIVWKSNDASAPSSDSVRFNLQLIQLDNVQFDYVNQKADFRIALHTQNLSFSGNFGENNYLLKGKGDLYLQHIQTGETNLVKNKNIQLQTELNINNNEYAIQLCNFSLNEMQFGIKGSVLYDDELKNTNLHISGKNLDIQALLSLLPDKHKTNIKDYESTGQLYAEGKITYENSWSTEFDFGFKNVEVTYLPQNAKLNNLNCSGHFLLNKKQSRLEINGLRAELMGDKMEAEFVLKDFDEPHLKLLSSGNINLGNLIKFWPIDTLSLLSGGLHYQAEIEGKLSELKTNMLSEKSSVRLKAEFSALEMRFKKQADTTHILTCDLSAAYRVVEVKNLSIKKGRSDVLINGKLEGVLNYFMDTKSHLSISGNLLCNNLRAEDFIFESGTNTKQADSEADVPDNVFFNLEAQIKNFSLGKFSAKNIQGVLELKNKKVFAEHVLLETMDGKAELDALFDFSGKIISVSAVSKLSNIQVTKLFYQFNNFGQSTLEDKNISGTLSAGIEFSGNWSKQLETDLKSLNAVADIKIDNGALNDFKPLESLSKFVDINDLKKIRFESLHSNIEIKNTIITIPKTAIKNSALNIDLWGTHSFNNEIDYHIQLLISELMAKKRKNKNEDEFGPIENDPDNRRSAFILMTGTVDKPIIKYDKKGLKQKIKEDIKQEKQTLKQILKDEFGLFKKDSIKVKEKNKSDQVFKLDNQKEEKDKKKKKEEEEDDDF